MFPDGKNATFKKGRMAHNWEKKIASTRLPVHSLHLCILFREIKM